MSFEWTAELVKLFNDIGTLLSKFAELAVSDTYHPFYITVDTSQIGLRAAFSTKFQQQNSS